MTELIPESRIMVPSLTVRARQLPSMPVWLVLVVGCVLQESASVHWGGGPVSLRAIVVMQGATWLAWLAAASMAVVPLSRRLPVAGPRAIWHALAHLSAAGTLGVLACCAAAVLGAQYYYGGAPAAILDMFRDRLHTDLATTVLAYGGFAFAAGIQRPAPESVTKSREGDPRSAPFTWPSLERLLLRHEGRLLVVRTRDVDWIEGNDDAVKVHVGADTHPLRETLAHLTGRLDPLQFARIHRSTIVNLDRIREIQPWFKGEHVLILRDGTRLTIGASYRADLIARLHGGKNATAPPA